MALDINDGYKAVQKKVSATQKYKNIKKDTDDLKKRKGESFETAKKETTEQLSSLTQKAKDFEKKIEKKPLLQWMENGDPNLVPIMMSGADSTAASQKYQCLFHFISFFVYIRKIKPRSRIVINLYSGN
jgi:hypothetical protein